MSVFQWMLFKPYNNNETYQENLNEFTKFAAGRNKIMEEYHSTEKMLTKRRSHLSTRWILLAVICAVVAGFVIGILIGRFATCPDHESSGDERQASYTELEDNEIGKLIINSVESENMRNNLR